MVSMVAYPLPLLYLKYMCVYVYIEPLRELETVRIKLVKDFIDEPMLFAKFPHPLNCILERVLINIVGKMMLNQSLKNN